MRFPAHRPKPGPSRRRKRKSRGPGLRLPSFKLKLPSFNWSAPGIKWPGGRSFGLLRSWLRLHAQTLFGSLGRLTGQPVASAMTMAVIGIALALPAGLLLLVTNLQGLSGHWDDSIELSLYLEPGQPEARATALAAEIGDWSEVQSTRVITADEGLAQLRETAGFGDAIDALAENPLPHLVAVRPAAGSDGPEAVAALAERLGALSGVDIVQADTDWVRRLFAMLDIARRMAGLAAVLLAVGVLIIVGNTIRLDIQNRRDEIEVMKLIGGTDGFIRRPLLYSGTWYGLGGGIAALAIVQLGLLTLAGPVERLAGLYGSGFRATGLGADGALVLVLLGAALGWLGSWLSATRHLRRIEPGL